MLSVLDYLYPMLIKMDNLEKKNTKEPKIQKDNEIKTKDMSDEDFIKYYQEKKSQQKSNYFKLLKQILREKINQTESADLLNDFIRLINIEKSAKDDITSDNITVDDMYFLENLFLRYHINTRE